MSNLQPHVYSALGSHANYPSSGYDPLAATVYRLLTSCIDPRSEQPHDSVLFDYCDKGMLWNPVLSAYFFHLDPNSLRLTRLSPSESDVVTSKFTSFFYFDGIWGDNEYAEDDPRQHKVPWVGLKRFIAGPQGPAYKGLVRKGLFPDNHGGKNVLQWAAAAFMAMYPQYFRTWRKWVTISVIIMVVILLVVGGRYGARRYLQSKHGYEQLPLDSIPLLDILYKDDRPQSPSRALTGTVL